MKNGGCEAIALEGETKHIAGTVTMGIRTILHTIETGGPGGAETVVLNLASKLDSSRFRSIALVPNGSWLPQRLKEQGITTYIVDSRPWYDPRSLASMVHVVRRENVDLIHSHLPDQNFYSCVVGRWTGRKTIATYHGPSELTNRAGLKGSIKRWTVAHSASAVVVVCDYVGTMLREAGFSIDRIERIYNGINACRFTATPAGRLRRELGCDNETRLVGMVANIRAPKGYEFFIRAARKVADAFPKTRFVSIGDVDPILGEPLKNLVSQLSLQGQFSFLGFRSDVPEILGDLDVFVLSSISEGLPLVALEAMAAGRPVVTTRSGGPAEVVDDGSTGFVVPPADPALLAERICELVGNPQFAGAMGLRGRAKVLKEFSLEQMVRAYERLYDRLLSSN